MPGKRLLLILFVLGLLGVFLWAAVNINREMELSGFTTSLEERSPEQLENLYLAAAKIDQIVLKPGDVFSFNEIVGERLRYWGFKGAPTIYHGQLINTPGGGLCQLSSTIYNAAVLGGMEILERTPHLWTITSVGPGRDAAIYYGKEGQVDLKFINRYDFPVKIRVETREKRLIVKFMTSTLPEENISMNVEIVQVIPAPRYPQYPHNNPASDLDVDVRRGRDGYKVRVHRIYKKNGKLINKELLSVDRYEPVPGTQF